MFYHINRLEVVRQPVECTDKPLNGNPNSKTMSMKPENRSLYLARIRIGKTALDAKRQDAVADGPGPGKKTHAVMLLSLPDRISMFIIY